MMFFAMSKFLRSEKVYGSREKVSLLAWQTNGDRVARAVEAVADAMLPVQHRPCGKDRSARHSKLFHCAGHCGRGRAEEPRENAPTFAMLINGTEKLLRRRLSAVALSRARAGKRAVEQPSEERFRRLEIARCGLFKTREEWGWKNCFEHDAAPQ